MDKYFICLANSYKRGGRCIAGIEILYDSTNDWTIIHNEDGTPHWIRPIAHTTYGEIPNITANKIQYFSIVKLTGVTPCPKELHTEDVNYSLMEVCDKIKPTTEILDRFVDNIHTKIFFNQWKAIPVGSNFPDAYSLMIIHPESILTYVDDSWEKSKIRIKITFNGTTYDLPVTDPIFIDAYRANPNILQNESNIYLALSLGLDFEGWHHKLIATVFNNIPKLTEKSRTVISPSNKWHVKEERSFTDEEINAVQNAVVVSNQYGYSVCFYMKAGGQSYIPLTRDSEIGVGEDVNIMDLRLMTLSREGNDDIMRVKYNKQPKSPKQLHPHDYEKWTNEEDRLLTRMHSSGASIDELIEKFGRNEDAPRSPIAKKETSEITGLTKNNMESTSILEPSKSKSLIEKIKKLFRKD